MSLFKGTATAMITPFKDGKIDYVAMGKLVEWQISSGIDGLVICGTTGEASTLSVREKVALVRFVVDLVKGRVPVIAGTGSNDTQYTLDLSKEMESNGADGLLIVTPYYNKCSETGLIKHYEKIADSINLPIIMYSVKSRTGVNISPYTVEVLSKHPRIAGIKEASGDMAQIVKIAQYIGDDFDLISGNDDVAVPILSIGGTGCISTVSNLIPDIYASMLHDFLRGNFADAGKMQVYLKDLIDAMFSDVNPIPLKAAMNMVGRCNLEYRLPLCPPSSKNMYMIFDILKSYNLIKD